MSMVVLVIIFDRHELHNVEKKNHHEAHEKNDGGIEYDDTKLKLDVAELGRTLKVRALCHFHVGLVFYGLCYRLLWLKRERESGKERICHFICRRND